MNALKHVLALLLWSSSLNAQNKDTHLEKARSYFEKQEYVSALSEVDSALKQDSVSSDLLCLKALILSEKGDLTDAFETYSKIISYYPKDAYAYNNRGLLLKSVQEFEYALMDFDQALSLATVDSIRMHLYLNRGAVKTDLRKFDEAYYDYYAAYLIDSTDLGVINNLAVVADEIGKGELTLKYLQRIIDIDPNFYGAYANIGFKYQLSGEYQKSLAYFDKCIELNPKEGLAYNNRAYSLLKLGKLKEAMVDVNKGLELFPGNSYGYRNRALIHIQNKNNEAACNDINRALQLNFTTMYGDEVLDLQKIHCK